MKKRLVLALACLAVVGFLGWAQGEDTSTTAKTPEKANFWMKKKLEYSERILEGLANEDFDKIRENAKAMNGLSYIENWVNADRAGYRTQTAVFHHANERLVEQANAENLDGAALAFVQLTMSCVDCHKLLRDPKQAGAKK